MLSGALIKLPDDLEIERLDGINWEREEYGLSLRSLIQFQEPGDTTAQAALAIHQYVGREATLLEEEDGRFSILHHDTVMTIWAYIYVVRGFVVADRLENRVFVQQIINKGLNLSDGAHGVYLDTARMARDHADQWVRGFSDRLGRVDRGTVFGEGVERDSVFGPELGRSTSKSVGWTTNFFGAPSKVRVSPRGSVTVWANPPIKHFLRFLRMEILPYIISR